MGSPDQGGELVASPGPGWLTWPPPGARSSQPLGRPESTVTGVPARQGLSTARRSAGDAAWVGSRSVALKVHRRLMSATIIASIGIFLVEIVTFYTKYGRILGIANVHLIGGVKAKGDNARGFVTITDAPIPQELLTVLLTFNWQRPQQARHSPSNLVPTLMARSRP